MASALDKYRAKRTAGRTPEPFGGQASAPGLFVVQQHAASHLHYDLRLELDGTLKSWAVPKGPSLDPTVKRAAILVEDHPVEYGGFEGHIPEGNYGAGAVIVWDRGRWLPEGDARAGLEEGKLVFELQGYKLKGQWALVRTKRDDRQWLLIKHRDHFATGQTPGPESVLSGLTVEALSEHLEPARALRASLKRDGVPHRKVDPTTLSPMLCQPRDAPFSDPRWVFELKYDGYRLFATRVDGEVRLFLRRGSQATNVFPDLVAALTKLPYDGLVLDGEVVVLDDTGHASFQLLQQRAQLRRSLEIDRASLRLPATYVAFDLLAVEGFDLRDLPLVERKRVLRTVLPPAGPIAYADHIEEHGEALWDEVVRRHLEGMVAKRADARYRSGRSSAWLKIALGRRADFVVVGFTAPEGSRQALGSLLLGVHHHGRLMLAGAVGTGFSDDDLHRTLELLEPDVVKRKPVEGDWPRGGRVTWVKPRHVVEVHFKEWTNDGRIRQPVFVRWRPDKLPEECVRDPQEAPAKELRPARPPTPRADKIFWPDAGYTKGDLVAYYEQVAPWLLPYLRDRPLLLTRYPDGIDGKSFFQKDAPSWAPAHVRRVRLWSEERQAEVSQFVCDDAETLRWLADMGTIPLHVWASRVATLERPDWASLDLDPKSAPFEHVVQVALATKALCDGVKLPAFVKTTGSTGLHVLIALGRQLTHEQARQWAELIARLVVERLPDLATVERQVARRGGRVYVDFGQNGRGKTLASPLCVRPVPFAGVSMPLRWEEVTPSLSPSDFHLGNAVSRLRKLGEDPLLPVLTQTPDLAAALERLSALSRG